MLAISACSTVPQSNTPAIVKDPQDLLIVDCLLPSQVRQLGTQLTYLAPRQAIRTPGSNCALRGGEYVAHDKADFRSALAIWLPLAENGDPQAQTYVGEIYEKSLGTRASYSIAAQWYKRAAQQNYARAQINLGYLYESGLGVNRDIAQALNLYRKASGFTNAELEYVSSVEIANRKAARTRTQNLETQVALLQQEIKAGREMLRQQEQTIHASQSETELKRAQTLVSELKQKLIEQEARLSAQTNTLASLTSEMAEKEEEKQTEGRVEVLVEDRVEDREEVPAKDQVATDRTAVDQITQRTAQENDTRIPRELAGRTTQTSTHVKAPEIAKESAIIKRAADNFDWGNYHALIIGNSLYDELTNLDTANNDAIAVEQILREKYGFQTDLLLDANQKAILIAMERMRSGLGPDDNLVIYYAGHGQVDPYNGSGFWLPVDANESDRQRWIANSALTAMIDTMKAKHVFVIADSSYSGSFSRTALARPLPETSADLKAQWLKAVSRSRVRTVLSSGGTSPVIDGAPDARHSIFANSFLSVLRSNTGILEAYGLFYQLQKNVAQTTANLNVKQIPQYAPIRHAGHQAGDFLFVPVSPSAATGDNPG